MDISEVKTIGTGISRPEGVMVLDDGTILAADANGRCSTTSRDGRTEYFGNVGGTPNGICVDGRGNCIIANIGNGQVQSLSMDGRHEVLFTEADGKRLPSPNFPLVDFRQRLWVSNSSYREDLDEAMHKPAPDGCIVLYEKGRPRIVAEDIYFANGLAVDKDETHLYVAETFMRRVLRFTIAEDGSLVQRRVYGPETLGKRGFPDGVAFDEAGNLWVTFPMGNAIGYITPSEELVLVLEDKEGRVLRNPSNICFGWEGRKTGFVGSIGGTSIPYFKVPHPGLRLVHQR